MKPHLIAHLSQFPCHICGRSSFEWGETDHRLCSFYGIAAPIVDELPTARLCTHCGNLQIFATKTAEAGSDSVNPVNRPLR